MSCLVHHMGKGQKFDNLHHASRFTSYVAYKCTLFSQEAILFCLVIHLFILFYFYFFFAYRLNIYYQRGGEAPGQNCMNSENFSRPPSLGAKFSKTSLSQCKSFCRPPPQNIQVYLPTFNPPPSGNKRQVP